MLFEESLETGRSGYFGQTVRPCKLSGYAFSFWYKLSQGCDLEYTVAGNSKVVLPGPQGPGQWQYYEIGYAVPEEVTLSIKIGAVKKGTAACGVSIDDIAFHRYTDFNPAPTRRETAAAHARLETINL